MTADLVAPAILAIVAATAGGWLRRRVAPRHAVVLLTGLAVVGAAAVLWALSLIIVGGVIAVPEILSRFEWCQRVLARSHRAPVPVAVAAAVALIVGAVRIVGFDRRWRRTVGGYDGHGGVDIVATNELVAFAAPGRPGTVVVSEGLLALLDEEEQAAVVAHEQTHLAQGHSRYLRVAGWAAAAVPLLLPLTRQLRFATERAADEGAVAVVGDRRIVARAIARAALATSPSGVLAAGGDSVSARVAELLDPGRPAWLPVVALLSGVLAATAAVMGSTLQLHHLFAFALHVCGLS